MNKPLSLFVVLSLFAGALYWSETQDPFARAPVGLIDSDPVQSNKILPPFSMPSFDFFTTTYRITPLAGYEIKARVLAKTRYFADDMTGDLVPYDFGLGWREMSDLSVVTTYFTFRHQSMSGGMRGLWTEWKLDEQGNVKPLPASLGNMQAHYSNNHLIPANKAIFAKLGQIKTGDMVHLKGYLVRAQDPARPWWEMTSSTSRNDTATHWGGNNSNCEVMYVTEATRISSTMPYTEEAIPDRWW